MTTLAAPAAGPAEEVTYPESDGAPIADNTLQFQWIQTIQGGIDALFADRDDVFVAGDLLWYPVEGDNLTRVAPDVLVAFGRPKGVRGSYLQWREGGVAPQVVIEILSPGNRVAEMDLKLAFYDRFGVEEYYLYDPYLDDFAAWVRSPRTGRLAPVDLSAATWTSPRLGVRFDAGELGLAIYGPDGEPFLTYVENVTARRRAERERDRMEADLTEAEAERDAERERAEAERERAERMAARLRALGVDPDAA